MSINEHAMNHKRQLMDMGGREEIMLERIDTRLIDPSLNRTTTYICGLIFILTQKFLVESLEEMRYRKKIVRYKIYYISKKEK
jgi:hypothetical protein